MVTRQQMELIAWNYDTVMSRAMLVALGVISGGRGARPRLGGRRRRRATSAERSAEDARYEGAADCMRQRHGVYIDGEA